MKTIVIQELYDFTNETQDSKYSFFDSHRRPSSSRSHQWRGTAKMHHFMTIPASRKLISMNAVSACYISSIIILPTPLILVRESLQGQKSQLKSVSKRPRRTPSFCPISLVPFLNTSVFRQIAASRFTILDVGSFSQSWERTLIYSRIPFCTKKPTFSLYRHPTLCVKSGSGDHASVAISGLNL